MTKHQDAAHVHVYPDGRVVSHHHDHGHGHGLVEHHHHEHVPPLRQLETKILAHNDGIAENNRQLLAQRKVAALNMMSSPGAGKTTLLTRTLPELMGHGSVAVIEGDQATSLDADRIARTGAAVVQINTGKGCHLEASMIATALLQLDLAPSSLLIIENVGNLVCPALFDLGQAKRIVLLSVTEGDDKPEKYPNMFAVADLVVLTKVDLLPHVDFSVPRAQQAVRRLRPAVEWLEVSAKTGAGMQPWLSWLEQQRLVTAPG